MFLQEAAIRYVYKDFDHGKIPTINDIKELAEKWESEYAESPFCNSGDFDIDDLKEVIPGTWNVEETGQLTEGQCRIAIAAVNYNGERDLNLDIDNIQLQAFNLCGLSVINAIENHEDVFGEEWDTREPFEDKIVLFMYKYPSLNCDPEILESPLDSIEDAFDEWIDCIENPPSQEKLDSKLEMLKKMFG
jgi:hypothetical protein